MEITDYFLVEKTDYSNIQKIKFRKIVTEAFLHIPPICPPH
jgi:hypothetical protein